VVFVIGLCAPSLSGCGSESKTTFATGGDAVVVQKGTAVHVSFEPGGTPSFPADFVSVLGDFRVQPEPAATGTQNVLRQVAMLGDNDFPRIILARLTFTDVIATVRCRSESGQTDAACGLMVRVRDSENYYVARANATEGSVNLYRALAGDREIIASSDANVTRGEWHTLSLSAIAKQFSVSWDGREVITTSDDTFSTGKVGLWTKADSVTSFDDLEVKAP
jgi:hypothetical protein